MPDSIVPGYYVRRGKLALEIKVHRSATAEECASVGEELGVSADDVAPDPCKPEFWRGWGPAWLELLATRDPAHYADLEGFAFDDAICQATEDARELFGPNVKLYTDGRSGGWLVLEGRGLDDESVEQAHACVEDPNADEEESQHGRELLDNLGTFREHVAAAVADFPRAVAWQVCANAFQPAATDCKRGRARTAAQDALAKATKALRDAAATDAIASIMIHGEIARTLPIPSAVEAYDAAKAELERLEGEGGAA